MVTAHTKNRRDLFVMQIAQCPSCGQRANIKVSEQKETVLILLIPIWFPWDVRYYGTCGSCFETFEMDKKEMGV